FKLFRNIAHLFGHVPRVIGCQALIGIDEVVQPLVNTERQYNPNQHKVGGHPHTQHRKHE
ncbi:MAG: hypothetical protein RL018_968, partial [Pseudomonadota bacterium]